MKNTDICLINMPYASLERPSLALGLINQYISDYGHQVKVLYGNLEFASRIGIKNAYFVETTNHEDLVGEWTFARSAFPDYRTNDSEYFSLFPHFTESVINRFLVIREQAEAFIKELAYKILALKPKIVGCTSTFQQNCASLALLRHIKAANPEIITIMGGANCEGIMGQTIVDSFPWLDFAFSGECDEVIGEFIDNLLNGNFTSPNGVITGRHKNSKTKLTRAYVQDMRKVGVPFYGSYFNTLTELNLSQEISPGLTVETSRGCWWGAKRHCSFCGLNGSSMEHRSKTPERVINEFMELSNRHEINKIEVVDNILPANYMASVLPTLAEVKKKYSIFYETKANLSKNNVEKLANAGVKWIQPGIESLHDDFLELINKGTTAMQNIAALKWCREYGVRVSWNILSCAPGEKEEWYLEMAKWIPLISHLQPPQQSLIKIRYPRFSPYFERPADFGLTLKPIKSYEMVYPLDEEDLFNIAYFFEGETDETAAAYSLENSGSFTSEGHKALQDEIYKWVDSFWWKSAPPVLCMVDHGDSIHILDSRKVATKVSHELRGTAAEIYRECYTPSTLTGLEKKFKHLDNNTLLDNLQLLITNKLLLYLSNRYIALALEGSIPPLPKNEDYPGGFLNFNKQVNQAKVPQLGSGLYAL